MPTRAQSFGPFNLTEFRKGHDIYDDLSEALKLCRGLRHDDSAIIVRSAHRFPSSPCRGNWLSDGIAVSISGILSYGRGVENADTDPHRNRRADGDQDTGAVPNANAATCSNFYANADSNTHAHVNAYPNSDPHVNAYPNSDPHVDSHPNSDPHGNPSPNQHPDGNPHFDAGTDNNSHADQYAGGMRELPG